MVSGSFDNTKAETRAILPAATQGTGMDVIQGDRRVDFEDLTCSEDVDISVGDK